MVCRLKVTPYHSVISDHPCQEQNGEPSELAPDDGQVHFRGVRRSHVEICTIAQLTRVVLGGDLVCETRGEVKSE